MATLARLYDFTAGQPIASSEVDNELNQIVNMLNSTSTTKNIIVRFNDASVAVLKLDQLGAGPVQDWFAGGVAVASLLANGQFQSYLATGTKPFSVLSTTKVDNLNVDAVDGFHVPTTFLAITGSLVAITSTAGNSAGSGDTTLHSKTLGAGLFANNQDVLHCVLGGFFAANANAKRVRVTVAGTTVIDSTSSTLLNGSGWRVDLTIVRLDSDSVKVIATFTSVSSLVASFAAYSQIDSLNFSSTITIAVTGNGVSSNDVVQEISTFHIAPGA